jgi:PEP-CTERM motif
MKKIVVTCLAVSAINLFTGISAHAQVTIINQNFDSGLSSTESLGGYYGGDITGSTYGIVAGDGTGGTSALEEVNTTAGNTGMGYGYGAVQLQESSATGNTSANLSDYTLSFDAMCTTGGSLNLQIQTWSGTGFGGTGPTTLNTAPANPGYGNDLTLTSSYTHFDLNFGNSTIFQDSSGFTPTGGTLQITFQVNGGGNGNPSSITFDVDNVVLTMVPEPSSLALGALSALSGFAFFRRRKK